MIRNLSVLIVLFLITCTMALVPIRDVQTLSELSTTSEDPTLFTEFGWALLFNNQPERASVTFNLALRKEPRNPDALEGLFLSEKMTGDYKNATSALSQFIRFHPDDPRSEVYLPVLFTMLEDVSKRSDILGLLNYIINKTDASPFMKDLCLKYQILAFLDMNRTREASEIVTRMGYIKQWWMIGPFDNEGKTGHNAVYPPETEIEFDAVYKGKNFDATWRLMPFESPYGKIYLKRMFYPFQNTCAYLACAVYSPTTRTVALKVGSSGAVKAFLNGSLVIENDSYRVFSYDQEIAPCVLKSGWNLLLLKICNVDGEWTASARFTELNGSAIDDLRISTSQKDIITASAQTPSEPSSYEAGQIERGCIDEFTIRALNTKFDPLPYLYLGLLESQYHYHDSEIERESQIYEQITDIMPDWCYGYFLTGTTNPGGNTARDLYETSIKLCPGLAEGWMELGRLFYNAGRKEKAVNAFQKALSINPDYIEPRQYIAKMSYENNWYPIAETEVRKLLLLNKDYIFAYYDLGRLSEHIGDDREAIENYLMVLGIEANSYYAISSLVERYKFIGEVDNAIELLKDYTERYPYHITFKKDLLDLYIDTERYNEAEKTADEILEINPRDFEALSWKGIALHHLGYEEKAIESFELAIKYKQNYPWLTSYMNILKPGDKPYYEPYRMEMEDVADKVASYLINLADEQAIYLLDQEIRKVYPNGTSSYTVHKIVQINTEDAMQKFASMEIYYIPERENVKILTATVILPDGERVEATDIHDYSVSSESARLYYDYVSRVVSFPALEPGAIIDFEYTVEQTGENIFADYFWEQFFFGNYETTIISEYVLITPENIKLNISNPPDIDVEVLPGKDYITHIFRKNNIDGILNEPRMPPLAEILNTVKVTTFESWDEVGRWYWNLSKDQMVTDAQIKRKVYELTHNKETIEEKVESIYNFITKEIRYVGLEFGIGGYKPRKATRTFSTHYGDCKDKGVLFMTMLKEIGVESDMVLIRSRSKGIIDYDLPLLGVFNHFITLVHLPDKDMFIDCTPEFHNYTELPFEDQGIDAFVVGEWGSKFITTPLKTPEDNFIDISMEIWLSEDGSAKAKRTISYGDKDSPAQRKRYLNPAQRKRLLNEYWNSLYPHSSVSNLEFRGIDNKKEGVEISYNIYFANFATAQNNIWCLPTRIPTDDLVQRFTSRSMRVYPLLVEEPFTIRSTIVYHLPDSAILEEDMPISIEMNSRFGNMKASYEQSNKTLTANVNISIEVTRVMPEDYCAFRGFLNEIDMREREYFTIKLLQR